MYRDAFCPKCGRPRQQGSVCEYGYADDAGRVTVVGKSIEGISPMILPERCVKCGRDASQGRRHERTLYGYSPWWSRSCSSALLWPAPWRRPHSW